jgi:hypothetical protein
MNELPTPPNPRIREEHLAAWAERHARPSPQSKVTPDQWRLAGILAGVGVIVGSLLPWATVLTIFGEINVDGTRGDGKITLAAGALIVLGFVIGAGAMQTLAGIGAALVGIVNLISVSRAVGDAESEYTSASTGYGLYLVVAAALVAVVAATVLNRKRQPAG